MKADSPLVTYVAEADRSNYTAGRATYSRIREITIHHCAGNMSTEALGQLWQRPTRNGSSHYGIHGTEVGQYVPENCIAWTNTNWPANCRAVTIETSNSGGGPGWPVSDASLETLVHLVADIAKRNGLHPLILGQNLTWHSRYAATACPGPYLYSRLQQICDAANEINAKEEEHPVEAINKNPAILQIGPASAGDLKTLKVQAEELLLPCTEIPGGVLLIGPASAGDQIAILTTAAVLDLPYAEYKEKDDGDQEDQTALVAELRAQIKALNAEKAAMSDALTAARAAQQQAERENIVLCRRIFKAQDVLGGKETE